MMRKISFAVLLLVMASAPAWAAPRTADDWYEEGANQYTLGNFEKAIDAFKAGFSLEPDESKKANYLYNIAQAYRQTHDCKNALFFYKRFLALKANDAAKPLPAKTRKAVEDFIAEADTCVRQQTQLSEKPPVNNVPPDGEAGDKGRSSGDRGRPPGETTRQEPSRKEVASAHKESDPDGDPEDTGVTQAATTGQPRVISARVIGGASKVNAGSISVPIQATFGVVGGYPIPVNPRLTIEAGAAFTFTPTPYNVGGMDKRGSLWGLMANAAATYEVIPKLGIRADVGLGALVFAGIDQSPFTDGAPTSGALGMFHVRAAVSADYAITPNVVLTAMPGAFGYSPAAAGIVGGGSIMSFDFMVGIGYRK
jgi:hypothetical protein